MTTTLSVLEMEYNEPTRPYSQKELTNMENRLYKYLRLGKIRAHHSKCDHFYLVKENGRKEKEIIEKDDVNAGHCSVCWKFGKTPKYLKNPARNLIEEYSKEFFESNDKLTYSNVDLENSFYKWLYLEFGAE